MFIFLAVVSKRDWWIWQWHIPGTGCEILFVGLNMHLLCLVAIHTTLEVIGVSKGMIKGNMLNKVSYLHPF